ncbi:hypothetical protein K2X30_13430 [bacterium]|jgi:hypothetical protein|nr:hypothetical protein [bacterium]
MKKFFTVLCLVFVLSTPVHAGLTFTGFSEILDTAIQVFMWKRYDPKASLLAEDFLALKTSERAWVNGTTLKWLHGGFQEVVAHGSMHRRLILATGNRFGHPITISVEESGLAGGLVQKASIHTHFPIGKDMLGTRVAMDKYEFTRFGAEGARLRVAQNFDPYFQPSINEIRQFTSTGAEHVVEVNLTGQDVGTIARFLDVLYEDFFHVFQTMP